MRFRSRRPFFPSVNSTAKARRKHRRNTSLHRPLRCEMLEDRRMLSDWSGHLTARAEPYLWNDTSEPYNIVGNLYVDLGATLEIGPGVEVYTNTYNSGYKAYDFNVEGTVDGTGVTY